MSDRDAEQGRVEAERGRVEAERGRDVAERAAAGRVENEGNRVAAEEGASSGRRVAERRREENEQARQTAERDREEAEIRRDGWWHRHIGGIVGALVGICAALAFVCAYGLITLRHEAEARRDENCLGWEKAHAQEIVDLKRSFAFYTQGDADPALRAILESPISIAATRDRIRDTKSDLDEFGQFVPDYCDEPGVGVLKEPDPKVPKTPPEVQRLIDGQKARFPKPPE